MAKKRISAFSDSSELHDEFFRRSLQNHPKVLTQFLTNHLPKNLLAQIDITVIEYVPMDLFPATGGKLIGDFAVKTKLNDKDAFVIFAIEHQSSNDFLMALRMHKYIIHLLAKIAEQQQTDGKLKTEIKLPLIYPMVVYHGRSACTFSNDIRDLIDAPRDLVDAPRDLVDAYFLRPFQLIDFSIMEDEKLKRQSMAGLLGLGLKYVFDNKNDSLSRLLESIKFLLNVEKLISPQELHYVEFLLEYLMRASDFDRQPALEGIMNLAGQISEEAKEKIMTIAEQLREEGMQQGMQRGIQQGVLEGMQRGEFNIVMRLLHKKFGGITKSEEEKLSKLSTSELEELSERLLEAKDFDELFN